MSTDAVEREVQRTAARWAFVQRVETVDKTDDAIKLQLHIDDGSLWHRHPPEKSDQHDFSPDGQRVVSLDEFLKETQQILQDKGLL